MDGLVDACKVPCVYKSFGCERYIDQHSLAEHSSRWLAGEPRALSHGIIRQSLLAYGVNIKYETCYTSAVLESLEDHRRVLVVEEDDNVFLLAVGTGKARAGHRPVSVVCVRGNAADADTRPVYGCMLTVTASPKYEGTHAASITLTGTVPGCSVPGNVDMEDAWYDFHPKMMHGDSKEVHLVICITKSTIHH
ncbi:uncharacterized protein [Aegilops tauschii subsp. strangulata]|uniref:uncharacterized protein n=1 Tax=Aegilops tauschii subsp. strangulata TaxID=200361 RepID=UPI00098B5C41|nr:uncharacterized protein LOC109739671 [Aegilops tauschii subsp. strangulata]